ncbi:hypothetical protein MSSAC_2397 [Methanosarcina siciliae C2J]|uniref:Uncharacterized protein n=1 Tax=Methanosarcina siciliae C2J TaxID=1434118 RepID=A0A0E3PP37_9EURY|nr:hypothetical protein [Methanosarcina siciliae]AKB36987.1 hypothetical protein MSSAC_2397 [Methanosarcina siciliae C2J]
MEFNKEDLEPIDRAIYEQNEELMNQQVATYAAWVSMGNYPYETFIENIANGSLFIESDLSETYLYWT